MIESIENEILVTWSTLKKQRDYSVTSESRNFFRVRNDIGIREKIFSDFQRKLEKKNISTNFLDEAHTLLDIVDSEFSVESFYYPRNVQFPQEIQFTLKKK